jgi:hypothetical protein
VFFWLGPVLAVSWLTISLLDPDPGRSIAETMGIGYFFGTMFSHTTLAAAWNAFGPLPLVWRLPLSLVWIAMLALAIGINIGVNGGPQPGQAMLLIGGCLFLQWVLLQFPFWGLALRYGLRLRHIDDAGADPREHQFRIRQLLIVTTIVAVVFGIGRAVIAATGERINLRGEAPIFIFLALAAIILTLPLLLAALMRSYWAPAVIVALVLIGLATAWEVPLLRMVHSGGGPNVEDFVSINAFTAGVMLLLLTIVRLNGYSLATAKG